MIYVNYLTLFFQAKNRTMLIHRLKKALTQRATLLRVTVLT